MPDEQERTLKAQLAQARLEIAALRDQNLWQKKLLAEVDRRQPALLRQLVSDLEVLGAGVSG